jgi:hypothetical protein
MNAKTRNRLARLSAKAAAMASKEWEAKAQIKDGPWIGWRAGKACRYLQVALGTLRHWCQICPWLSESAIETRHYPGGYDRTTCYYSKADLDRIKAAQARSALVPTLPGLVNVDSAAAELGICREMLRRLLVAKGIRPRLMYGKERNGRLRLRAYIPRRFVESRIADKPPQVPPSKVTASDAGRLLKLGRHGIYRLIRQGKLSGEKVRLATKAQHAAEGYLLERAEVKALARERAEAREQVPAGKMRLGNAARRLKLTQGAVWALIQDGRLSAQKQRISMPTKAGYAARNVLLLDRKEVEALVRERAKGSIPSGKMSVKEAARRLRLAPSTVANLVLSGCLSSRKARISTSAGHAALRRLLDRREVEALVRQRASSPVPPGKLLVKDAARLLKVSSSHVHWLLHCGTLTAAKQGISRNAGSGSAATAFLLDRREVEALVRQRADSQVPPAKMSVRDAARTLKVSEGLVRQLIHQGRLSCEKRRIPPKAGYGHTSTVLLDRKEVEALARQRGGQPLSEPAAPGQTAIPSAASRTTAQAQPHSLGTSSAHPVRVVEPVPVYLVPNPEKPQGNNPGAPIKYPGLKEYVAELRKANPRMTWKQIFGRCSDKFGENLPADAEALSDYCRAPRNNLPG